MLIEKEVSIRKNLEIQLNLSESRNLGLQARIHELESTKVRGQKNQVDHCLKTQPETNEIKRSSKRINKENKIHATAVKENSRSLDRTDRRNFRRGSHKSDSNLRITSRIFY